MKIVRKCACKAQPIEAVRTFLTTLSVCSVLVSNQHVYAGSSAPSVPLAGLDVETLEEMALPVFYEKLRGLGFTPNWSYRPGKQSASYSKDFWCEKTWTVSWRVAMRSEKPVATEVDLTFINACE